jgi:ABC-type lipoprotein release transport system permease subunit
MLSIKLAFRNLVGAGLRTWLNVFVLSVVYILMIWHYGVIDGWNIQAKRDMLAWETGNGQYWHQNYDPYDFFTLEESHAKTPEILSKGITDGNITPVLITQASVYPDGRIQSMLLKGIDTDQQILELPTAALNADIMEIPAIIGKRMAKNCKLKKGDVTTIRWRDINGTFDATEVKIVEIFDCNVPNIDLSQMWISIEDLREMMQTPDEATYFILGDKTDVSGEIEGWEYKDYDYLMAEMDEMIKMKKVGGSFLYIILIMLAMLAIFDTQVLSIFRRQKEIGTYIAMGMTRGQVVRLFTVEGAMHAILAVFVGAIYGVPFLMWNVKNGFTMGASTDEMGLAAAETIFPAYGFGLILTTVLLVLTITTIVSYMPARKISKMNPTEAIKGKIQ